LDGAVDQEWMDVHWGLLAVTGMNRGSPEIRHRASWRVLIGHSTGVIYPIPHFMRTWLGPWLMEDSVDRRRTTTRPEPGGPPDPPCSRDGERAVSETTIRALFPARRRLGGAARHQVRELLPQAHERSGDTGIAPKTSGARGQVLGPESLSSSDGGAAASYRSHCQDAQPPEWWRGFRARANGEWLSFDGDSKPFVLHQREGLLDGIERQAQPSRADLRAGSARRAPTPAPARRRARRADSSASRTRSPRAAAAPPPAADGARS
jgi:hypothetical protein